MAKGLWTPEYHRWLLNIFVVIISFHNLCSFSHKSISMVWCLRQVRRSGVQAVLLIPEVFGGDEVRVLVQDSRALLPLGLGQWREIWILRHTNGASGAELYTGCITVLTVSSVFVCFFLKNLFSFLVCSGICLRWQSEDLGCSWSVLFSWPDLRPWLKKWRVSSAATFGIRCSSSPRSSWCSASTTVS